MRSKISLFERREKKGKDKKEITDLGLLDVVSLDERTDERFSLVCVLPSAKDTSGSTSGFARGRKSANTPPTESDRRASPSRWTLVREAPAAKVPSTQVPPTTCDVVAVPSLARALYSPTADPASYARDGSRRESETATGPAPEGAILNCSFRSAFERRPKQRWALRFSLRSSKRPPPLLHRTPRIEYLLLISRRLKVGLHHFPTDRVSVSATISRRLKVGLHRTPLIEL